MKKLLTAALLALASLIAAPALADVGISYTNTVNNKVTIIPVTPSNPLPVGPPAASSSTSSGSTVTSGGAYQTVFAANTSRRGCLIQNPTTATEILNVRQAGAAVWTLPIGATFNCASPSGIVASDLIEVTATTTGHAFTAVSQ